MILFPEDPNPVLPEKYLKAIWLAAQRFPARHRARRYGNHAAELLGLPRRVSSLERARELVREE